MYFIFVLFIIFFKYSSEYKSDIKCYLHYVKYVQPSQNKNDYVVTFDDYLEYWSYGEDETKDELYQRVCNYIYDKYPAKYLRT